MAKLLIVDDEKYIRLSLVRFFDSLGYQVSEAENGADAAVLMGQARFDLILTDLRMAGRDGLDVIREARRIHPNSLVIMMTAFATVESAVAAIKFGAHDYIIKPFSLDQIQAVVENALHEHGVAANPTAREVVEEPPLLISRSPAMEHLLESALRAALSEGTVLLVGESGTGKNVLARQIHQWSARHKHPLIAVSCTTLSEQSLGRELFGDTREEPGASSSDRRGRLVSAEGGTVFLDEIADLPVRLQSKLLSFIEERGGERSRRDDAIGTGARIIAASNHDLDAEVTAGRFRKELFYRLNVITLRVPPLRERREDIVPLAEWMLKASRLRDQRARLSLSAEAAAALGKYQWPGNVRELRNSLARAALLTQREVIEPGDLPDTIFRRAGAAADKVSHAASLEEVEREHIARVLGQSATLDAAATTLGINSATLWRKRKRYSIE
ncbi:MAG TPA: sigma-54 dependent transcriptional regulator [Candidatus Binataceae bacterium]|nr:sigma-54 dependent transcriptional regulator [Candidatus Binataceae bacterium]